MILKRTGYFSDHAMTEYCSKILLHDFKNNISIMIIHKELLNNFLYSLSMLTHYHEPLDYYANSLYEYLRYRYFYEKEPGFDFGAVYGMTQIYNNIKELNKI